MTKYISIKEFQEGGYLQEVNRRFLHPLGLALEVSKDYVSGNDDEYWLSGIWDYRDDPEGIKFTDITEDMKNKAAKIEKEWCDKILTRVKSLGNMVQPIHEENGSEWF